MVHHLMLFKLKPEVTPDQIETILVETRIRLLKIPEVMNLRCGKRIDLEGNPYALFVSMDFENLAKGRIAQESAIWIKYEKQIIDPYVAVLTILDYEMDPGIDVAYS